MLRIIAQLDGFISVTQWGKERGGGQKEKRRKEKEKGLGWRGGGLCHLFRRTSELRSCPTIPACSAYSAYFPDRLVRSKAHLDKTAEKYLNGTKKERKTHNGKLNGQKRNEERRQQEGSRKERKKERKKEF